MHRSPAGWGLPGPEGGLEPILRWLSPHWQTTAKGVLADPHRQNWKSALQEWSQGQGLGLPTYICEEKSLVHGDPLRFHCRLWLDHPKGRRLLGEGWGRSRRMAEQDAAREALNRGVGALS
jgi:ribonuclease-3